VPRERIHAMRAAFRSIFFGQGRLMDRARDAGERWRGFAEVEEVVAFILADSKRPICTPSRVHASDTAEAD
jgi:acyl-[acyl carrier protein]--UDP-N-acetylglucosamine O-acyltransferase